MVEFAVYSEVFADLVQFLAMQPLAHRAVPGLVVLPWALRTHIHPRPPLSLLGNAIWSQKLWLDCSLAILPLYSRPPHPHPHIQKRPLPQQPLLCMEEIWSTVPLVDRGSLELWGAGILWLAAHRNPLMAGKDLLLCRDHFPFHKGRHKDLCLPDLDLLRHQAPDFLAPEKCQSFSRSFLSGR